MGLIAFTVCTDRQHSINHGSGHGCLVSLCFCSDTRRLHTSFLNDYLYEYQCSESMPVSNCANFKSIMASFSTLTVCNADEWFLSAWRRMP